MSDPTQTTNACVWCRWLTCVLAGIISMTAIDVSDSSPSLKRAIVFWGGLLFVAAACYFTRQKATNDGR